jgi:hypothetical protein
MIEAAWSAFHSAFAISFWLVWGPIAWRAVRTGRLLANRVVYDRKSTPRMYWVGLLGMGSVALMVTGLAAWSIARLF